MGKIVPKLRKDLKVNLQMSRNSNRQWGLRVIDNTSGLLICDIEIDHEQFSDLLSGTHTDGKAEYYGSPNIGKKAEHMSITLKFKKNPGYGAGEFEKEIDRAAKEYEKKHPGWKVDRYKNSRHFDSTKLEYTTHAVRYVEVPSET